MKKVKLMLIKKRKHTITPSANLGLRYNKEIVQYTTIYSNFDLNFSIEKKNNIRSYSIEPMFKLEIKYAK